MNALIRIVLSVVGFLVFPATGVTDCSGISPPAVSEIAHAGPVSIGLPQVLLRQPERTQPVADQPELTGFVDSQIRMGVRFRISLYCSDRATAERAFTAAFDELSRLEKIFSDYDPNSETRWIDSQPANRPLAISNEMQHLLQRSLEIHGLTDGYFDVALGTLTKQWRAARRSGHLPPPSELVDAQNKCGSQHLQFTPKLELIKQLDGLELDFGGIAKGYAADIVIQLLKQQFAIERVLVDASGDLVAGEAPPNQLGWIVGLSHPAGDKGLVTRVYLRHAALASSGDSQQFVEVEQQRWSHLLNPQTKTPIIGQNLTLVFAADGATADALASALAVCSADSFTWIEAQFPEIAAIRYHRNRPADEIQTIKTQSWNTAVQQRLVPPTEK